MRTLRNALSSIRRYKLSALLNIVGLAVAFTIVYFLSTIVYYEFWFNNGIKDSDRVFRVEHRFRSDEDWNTSIDHYFIKNFVETSTLPECYEFASNGTFLSYYCSYIMPGSDEVVELETRPSQKGTIDVFGFEFLSGTPDAIFVPGNIAISQTTAEKYGLSVGSILTEEIKIGEEKIKEQRTVVAIFKDFPRNSDFAKTSVLRDFNSAVYYLGSLKMAFSDNTSGIVYVKLRDADDREAFIEQWVEYLKKTDSNENEWSRYDNINLITKENVNDYIRLTPINRTAFADDLSTYAGHTMTKPLVYASLSILVVVLIIAFINYFNFFVALIPRRIRSINTQKIMGADTVSLRVELFIESIVIVGVAILLGTLFIGLLLDAGIDKAILGVSGKSSISENLDVFAAISAIMFLAAIVTAVYPAYYVTSFTPAFVLKGTFASTRTGRILRNTLLGVQFIISATLISLSLTMYNQYYKMIKQDVGFDKEGIYLYTIYQTKNSPTSEPARSQLRDAIMRHPNVSAVSFASGIFGPLSFTTSYEFVNLEKEIALDTYSIERDFIDFMGIGMVAGRSTDKNLTKFCLVDEFTSKKTGITVGDKMLDAKYEYEVIGVCKNFQSSTSMSERKPRVFIYDYSQQNWIAYIRTTGEFDYAEFTTFVKEAQKSLSDGNIDERDIPVYIDDRIKEYNSYTLYFSIYIAIASGIAIFISLLGVFGLILFETQYRRKEIAIRRVNGATRSGILRMFNIQFLKIVAVCFVVSVPITVAAMKIWLQEFAYKVPISPLCFLVALLLIALLTCGIVSLSSWKAVNENPTDVLNSGN